MQKDPKSDTCTVNSIRRKDLAWFMNFQMDSYLLHGAINVTPELPHLLLLPSTLMLSMII
jgi:hypothetical protein